jgi:hypothetical protein
MTFVPTHTVPAAGMATWPNPDATAPQGPVLAAHLDVRVDRWWGDWAEVTCANGWTAWVNGRQLVSAASPVTRRAGAGAGVLGPLAAAGAAIVIAGSLLPWISAGGESVSAWDIPIGYLFSDNTSDGGFKTGIVLLLPALAVLPSLARRPLPDNRLLLAAAALASNSAVLLVLRVLGSDPPRPSLGVGVFVTFAGGGLMLYEYATARARTRGGHA